MKARSRLTDSSSGIGKLYRCSMSQRHA